MSRTEALPTVTLVVAMRNEERAIRPCLESIAAQDYPAGRLEVLIYDGQSIDESFAIATEFAGGRAGWIVAANPRQIQAAAWNAGIAAATGDIIGIVSAHAELGSSYVRRAVETLIETGADMVGGPVRAIADGPVGSAIAIATSSPFGVGGARHHYLTERSDVDTVFMGLARRTTWLEFPFDEKFVRNQDDELSYRLLDGGGRIVCDPAIQSTYSARSTFRDLWRQYAAYGFWKVRVLQAHPRQARPRHLAPVGLVATLAGSALLGLMFRRARALPLLSFGTYGMATAAAAAHYRNRNEPITALLLLIAFPVLHLAYGTGMIRGLWRFRRSANQGS